MNSIVLQFKDKACRLRDSQRSLLHNLPYLGWVFSPKGVCNHFLNKDEYASHGFWYPFLSSLLYSLVKKSLMGLTHVSATRAECSYEKYTPTLGVAGGLFDVLLNHLKENTTWRTLIKRVTKLFSGEIQVFIVWEEMYSPWEPY